MPSTRSLHRPIGNGDGQYKSSYQFFYCTYIENLITRALLPESKNLTGFDWRYVLNDKKFEVRSGRWRLLRNVSVSSHALGGRERKRSSTSCCSGSACAAGHDGLTVRLIAHCFARVLLNWWLLKNSSKNHVNYFL